jgi:hypothetical protein
LLRRIGIEVGQHALEVEPRDRLQALEVAEVGRVDDLEQRALAIEQAQDAVVVVRNFAEPDRKLRGVDLEPVRQRRELLEQARPLVEPAHAFHQEALRARRDRLSTPHRAELDLELAVVPRQ